MMICDSDGVYGMHLLEATLFHPRESTIITTYKDNLIILTKCADYHIPNVLDGSRVQDCL